MQDDTSRIGWKQDSLERLSIENGMRMRGLQTTRLDTLIDAAFAFVLSFLVMTSGDIPATFPQLIHALKTVPALAMSFLVLMLFWLEHRRWSRCFGLETKRTVFLSISLVFVLLVYIYPLRLLFEGMFHFMAKDFFPFDFRMYSEAEGRGFFAIYSIGFFVMSILVSGLYFAALKSKQVLNLNAYEIKRSKGILIRWLIAAVFAVVSLLLTYSLPLRLIHWAGFIYFGLFVVQYIQYKCS